MNCFLEPSDIQGMQITSELGIFLKNWCMLEATIDIFHIFPGTTGMGSITMDTAKTNPTMYVYGMRPSRNKLLLALNHHNSRQMVYWCKL